MCSSSLDLTHARACQIALTKPIGDPGRIRTSDTRFRRAVLYPLSYGANSELA